jgi:hypothetical protein
MKKKAATAAEKRHMDAVAAIGCIVCKNMGIDDTPACLHHIHGHAFGSRSNWRVAPICPYHHQDAPFGHCIHNGTQTFEANYMTEAQMLEQVNQELGL